MANNNYIQQWQTFSPYFSKSYIREKILTETNVLTNTNINISNNKIYSYYLQGNQTFTFNNNDSNCSFRLYLTMPNQIVSFTLPNNILWQNVPNFTIPNALYMLVFQWNAVLNKWLGNQMWKTVQLGE